MSTNTNVSQTPSSEAVAIFPAVSKSLKQYLGDAVYANFDGFHVVLTTEDGIRASNTIYLEPPVLANLDTYLKWLKEQK